MSYLAPNPSNLLGEESPEWLAKALNVGKLRLTTSQGGFTGAFAATIVRMYRKQIHYTIRTTATYAAGESYTLFLSYLDKDAQSVLLPQIVLDDTNTIERDFHLTMYDVDIPLGSAVSLSRIHTSGPSPVNPGISIVVQLY